MSIVSKLGFQQTENELGHLVVSRLEGSANLKTEQIGIWFEAAL
jgi:hypothetical protein